MSTVLLFVVLSRAMTALKVVVDATCTGTHGQSTDQSYLPMATTLRSGAFCVLPCAETGWAAAHKIDVCAAQTLLPPHSPVILLGPNTQAPHAARAAAVKGAATQNSACCIVLEPPNDLHGRQPTNLRRVGESMEVAVRSIFEPSSKPLLEMLRCTVQRNYAEKISVSKSTTSFCVVALPTPVSFSDVRCRFLWSMDADVALAALHDLYHSSNVFR